MTTFRDLGLKAEIVDALAAQGIDEPFPIQDATIADALAGRDVCGKAKTGSGKTLAFGLPALQTVGDARPGHPRALVLVPTRELAKQVVDVLSPLGKVLGVRVAAFYGGTSMERQIRNLRRRIEVVVATPGRLIDLLERAELDLDEVGILVIDEADRMADMGFLPEVRRILDETSPVRQTVLFSATLDGDVAVLQRKYQRADSVTHEIASASDDASVEHHFEEMDTTRRAARAAEIVRTHGSTIVFTRTRRGAERLAKQLATSGVEAAAIHGGLSQSKRDRALAGFKSENVEALIATDVAARGIHVDAVACVVHFDPPVDSKTYLHRSGRTARAGATGVVVSFVARDQRSASRKLRKELGLSPAATDPDRRETDRHARNRRKGSGSRRRSRSER